MNHERRITVEVPRQHLEAAQAYTGGGISETVRAALRMLAAESRATTRPCETPPGSGHSKAPRLTAIDSN